MKNKMKIFTIGLLTLSSSVLSAYAINGFQNQNRDDLIVSTEDIFNEKQNIAKYGIRRAASSQELDCSKIYAQYGFDGTNYYLRFATAVKGDLDDIKYTAKFVDSNVDIIEKNVYTVYKGIASDEEVNYYNGNSLVDANLTSTKDYYWACLTIKFNENSENMTRDIKVDIDVNNGAHADTRTTSLDALLNDDEEEGGETRKMTLGEYVLDQGTSPLFTFEKLESNLVAPSDSSNYPCNIAQGSCTDGEYLYIATNSSEGTSTYKNQFGKVIKYDINKQEVTDFTDIIGTAWKNDATGPGNANLFYNPIDKQIYLLGGTRSGGAGGLCPDWRINPETMEVTKLDEILNTDGFKFDLPDAQTYFSNWASNAITYDVENLEYNPTLQKWAVIFRVKSGGTDIKDGTKSVFRRLFFYDKDLKLSDGVQNIIVNNSVTTNTGYGIQEMTSDEKYIYIDYTAWPAKDKSIIPSCFLSS